MDNSGSLYKVKGSEKEPIENVLSQVNRHRRFLRNNISKDCKVVNLIVLSNPDTVAINNLDDPNFKIVVPDFVINLIEACDSEDIAMEKFIKSKFKELSAVERKFDFFDIEREIVELEKVIKHDDELSSKRIELINKNEEDIKSLILDRHTEKYREIYGSKENIKYSDIERNYRIYIHGLRTASFRQKENDLSI